MIAEKEQTYENAKDICAEWEKGLSRAETQGCRGVLDRINKINRITKGAGA